MTCGVACIGGGITRCAAGIRGASMTEEPCAPGYARGACAVSLTTRDRDPYAGCVPSMTPRGGACKRRPPAPAFGTGVASPGTTILGAALPGTTILGAALPGG